MKKVTLLFVSLLIVSLTFSQEETKNDTVQGPWKTGAKTLLNFSQVSLTNWAAGGENSISGNFLGNVFANYKKGNAQWDNSLDVSYGLMRQGQDELIKTDDKLELTSKYGRKAFMNNKNWYYSAMFSFRTQFGEGFDYPNDSVKISDFMSPGYFMLAIGMDYNPNDFFSASASPMTGKVTIVNDQKLADKGAFGVKPGENLRYEFGGFIKFMFKKEIWENVELNTKLELFSNYFNNPQNIDVNWEMLISMKVNDYLSASLNTNLIYDDDVNVHIDENDDGIVDTVGPRTQFKEMLGIGLTFSF
ncbi:MAG: DUF3078 domain-containing protein [Bacteroidales bacterium]|nr:DUF3078 domain-containing protein [Bacteroidales bacterium]